MHESKKIYNSHSGRMCRSSGLCSQLSAVAAIYRRFTVDYATLSCVDDQSLTAKLLRFFANFQATVSRRHSGGARSGDRAPPELELLSWNDRSLGQCTYSEC